MDNMNDDSGGCDSAGSCDSIDDETVFEDMREDEAEEDDEVEGEKESVVKKSMDNYIICVQNDKIGISNAILSGDPDSSAC
jgi:hypothetical protein